MASGSASSRKPYGGAFLVMLLAMGVMRFYSQEQRLVWVLPYLLLLSPFRAELHALWVKYAVVDPRIHYPAHHIPEIAAEDYSYDAIRQASDNFRHPVVVRGLFNNTRAVKYWGTEDYLPSVFQDFSIPIVRNATVGTLQDDRVIENFGEAFSKMWHSETSGQYLFFPVKSRYTFNGSETGSAQSLQEKCDEICLQDLDLDRIWPTFGTKKHVNYMGSQFVIGKSTPTFTSKSTGSDWHCAIGNNWFIQVAGRKHWEFIEPMYSPYLQPLKNGLFNIWTGNLNMNEDKKHIPHGYVDLEAGDLLYNPDWQWHTVRNYGGLSIGVPIRERNVTLSLQNNIFFSIVAITNKKLSDIGLSLGGFPPPSASTEQDN